MSELNNNFGRHWLRNLLSRKNVFQKNSSSLDFVGAYCFIFLASITVMDLSLHWAEFALKIMTSPIREERIMEMQLTTHLAQWPAVPSTMRDVAEQILYHFDPDYNDVDFEFMYGNKKLKYHCNVFDAGLGSGGVLKVNVVQRSKLRLHSEAPFHFMSCVCQRVDCRRRGRHVWGVNFIVNTEMLRNSSAHRQGERTPFSQITASLPSPDLINDRGVDVEQIAQLKSRSSSEWFWNCLNCDKCANVRTEECIPQDNKTKNGRLWEIIGMSGDVYCGECLEAGYPLGDDD